MKSLWVLWDEGKVGTYRQCLALATWLEEEYGYKISYKPIQLRFFYKWLLPQVMLGIKKTAQLQSLEVEPLKEPYPDLVIASGRQAVNTALVLRRHCQTIILQNPRINPKYFDLVISPYHDRLLGKNVFSTLGALHPIRPEQFSLLREQHYQGPTLTIVIGGDSNHYRYTADYINDLAASIKQIISREGPLRDAKLLITPSRRSKPELLRHFEQRLQGLDYELWDNQGDNPYLRYLACADAVIVTGDSISMMSEACITGKPVYICEVPTRNKRVNHFTKTLYEQGYACRLSFEPDNAKIVKPLDELDRIKSIIKKEFPQIVCERV
jgi:mitochondrial fission protein ELM1